MPRLGRCPRSPHRVHVRQLQHRDLAGLQRRPGVPGRRGGLGQRRAERRRVASAIRRRAPRLGRRSPSAVRERRPPRAARWPRRRRGALIFRADRVALGDDEPRRDRAAALCLDRSERGRRHAPGPLRALDRRARRRFADAQVGRSRRSNPTAIGASTKWSYAFPGRRRPDAGLTPSVSLDSQTFRQRAEQAAATGARRAAPRARSGWLSCARNVFAVSNAVETVDGSVNECVTSFAWIFLATSAALARVNGSGLRLPDLDLVVRDFRTRRGDRRLRDEVELVQRLDHLGLRHLAVVRVLRRAPDAYREPAERAGGGDEGERLRSAVALPCQRDRRLLVVGEHRRDAERPAGRVRARRVRSRLRPRDDGRRDGAREGERELDDDDERPRRRAVGRASSPLAGSAPDDVITA